MRLISVGFHNYIPTSRIVVIMDFDSSAARRLREIYRERYGNEMGSWVLDFTRGRRTQSCILLDTGHLLLSIRPRRNLFNVLTTEITTEDAESQTE